MNAIVLNLWFCVLLFLCSSCKRSHEAPDPQFSASIEATAGDWEATAGEMVYFQEEGYGGIRVRLTALCQTEVHELSMVISAANLLGETLQPFIYDELSEDRKGFGQYRIGKMYRGWQPRDQLSVEINVSEIKLINGRYFVSGSFEFSGCSAELSPICVGQLGFFENMSLQYGTSKTEIILSC